MLVGPLSSVRLGESSPLVSNTNCMAQEVSGRGAGAAGGVFLSTLVLVLFRCLHFPYLSQIGRDLVGGVAKIGFGFNGENVDGGGDGVEAEVVVEVENEVENEVEGVVGGGADVGGVVMVVVVVGVVLLMLLVEVVLTRLRHLP